MRSISVCGFKLIAYIAWKLYSGQNLKVKSWLFKKSRQIILERKGSRQLFAEQIRDSAHHRNQFSSFVVYPISLK